MKTKIIAIVLIVANLLLLSGCSEKTGLFKTITQEKLDEFNINEELFFQTPEDISIDNMKLISENNALKLYFNEKTAEIALVTSEEDIWFSNPQDRLSMDPSAAGSLSSQIEILTIDQFDRQRIWLSYSDSVQYGQFNSKLIESGISVEYLFGRRRKIPVLPMALTQERYEEIFEKFEKKEDSDHFARMYRKVDLSAVTSIQSRQDLIERYNNLIDLEIIYTLKSNPSSLELRRIETYMNSIGYNIEDRFSDHEFVGFEDEAGRQPFFSLNIEYKLENDGLIVNIPYDGIFTSEGLNIENITLLKYFNSEYSRNDGYAFVPDGSGAIINMKRIIHSSIPEYNRELYGSNNAILRTDKFAYLYNNYLPVFGLTNDKSAMLAIIESGHTSSSIRASAPRSEIDLGFVCAAFKLLEYSKVSLDASPESIVNLYPEFSNQEDLSVKYIFLGKDRNTYYDLADRYREELIRNNVFQKNTGTDEQVPLVVNTVGAIDDTEPLLGVPRTVIKNLTSFDQAIEIVEDLKQNSSNNSIVLKYSGWYKGGINSILNESVNPERKIGGRTGFENLIRYSHENEIKFFPDVDFQYVNQNRIFDRFNAGRDAVRFISQEIAYVPQYNHGNFHMDSRKPFSLMNNLNSMLSSYFKFVENYYSYDNKHISFNRFGTDLFSDFSKSNPASRKISSEKIVSILEDSKTKGYENMSKGINGYTIKYIDYAINIPFDCNFNPLFERSVPFLQIVLSSNIKYSAPDLNTFFDDDYYILKAIETGSFIYFETIYESNSLIKDTQYSDMFSVNYKNMRDKVHFVNDSISNALYEVYGHKITGHSMISDGVYKTDYENGKSIIVNYNDNDYSSEFGRIDKKSFLLVG